jgi:SAM-dependent methyltransferase
MKPTRRPEGAPPGEATARPSRANVAGVRLDPRAEAGFGSAADCYERGRPSYPASAITSLIDEFGVSRRGVVLDLGAGTGKVTRLLLQHVTNVIAVEPVPAMRRELIAQLPTVAALDGTAEAIPIADDSVDAVFVGEAFHWFRTANATAEIARVLRPRGGLALLWNVPTWTAEATPWLAAYLETVDHHKRAAGAYPAGNGAWKGPFEETRLFEELQRTDSTHVQHFTVDEFVAQVASLSWIAGLPDLQRAAVLRDVRAILPARSEIDIPYRTDIYWTRRR